MTHKVKDNSLKKITIFLLNNVCYHHVRRSLLKVLTQLSKLPDGSWFNKIRQLGDLSLYLLKLSMNISVGNEFWPLRNQKWFSGPFKDPPSSITGLSKTLLNDKKYNENNNKNICSIWQLSSTLFTMPDKWASIYYVIKVELYVGHGWV